MTTNSLNIKQFPVWVVNIRVQMLCFSYTAYPLPVRVRGIHLFGNFEKLSILLEFSSDILEGWARDCCAHVFLVFLFLNTQYWTVQKKCYGSYSGQVNQQLKINVTSVRTCKMILRLPRDVELWFHILGQTGKRPIINIDENLLVVFGNTILTQSIRLDL